PWPTLLLSLAAALLLATGVGRLGFTANYRIFFAPDDPELRAYEALERTYGPSDNCLFCIAPKDGRLFRPRPLEAVAELTAEAWELPHAVRVDSLTNDQHSYARGDDLVVEDLFADPASLTQAELARRGRIARADPLIAGRLVDPGGTVAGVNVLLDLDRDDAGAVASTVEAARALARRIEARYPEVRVHLTGIAVMNHAFQEASRADMETLFPAMGAVLFLGLAWLVGSLAAAAATLAVVLLAVAAALGAAGWLGIALSPATAATPILILTLGIADSVHLLATALRLLEAGRERRAAVAEALEVNLQPVTLTSLTTAVGFLCMNFSDVPPFHDLGNIVAMGVAAAWGLSLTFLPAAVVLLPFAGRPRAAGRRAMGRLGAWVVRHRRPLLLGAGPVVLACSALAPLNQLDDQFLTYFDRAIPFRTETEFVLRHLTGLYQIEYSLAAPAGSDVTDPAYLRQVAAFAHWWRGRPRVLHVAALSDLLARLNRNMHGEDPAYDRVPGDHDLAAQYLLLYELSLPPGLDLSPLVAPGRSASRMVVTFRDLTSRQLRDEARAGRRWLARHAPGLASHGAGPSLMFAHVTLKNIHAMLAGTAVALAVISACLVAALRSWRIGLASLLPNVVPAAMGFGLWGLASGRIGMALAVVASMTLGIVVDDTIHILSRYLRNRRDRGLDPEAAVAAAVASVGVAVVTTSVILVAGFAVLATSHFRVNAEMGALSALVIAIALAADLLLLPPLVLAVDRPAAAAPRAAAAEEG
ncbi:MAG: RND transporter, partial [Nitrospirae bacterium]